MAEKMSRLYPVEVRMYCDECKTGELIHTGVCLTSNPPQFPHVCNSCGYTQTFRDKYYPQTRQLTEEQIKEMENESSS